jgi:hypothetical protein
MAKLSSLLHERFKKKEQPKISELAEKTSEGHLTPFAGVFGLCRTEEKDRIHLKELLHKYAVEEHIDISNDLSFLLEITAEVKAIHNQAAILHGERIKRAQDILKKYREGAFSAWLVATYGNRQTPYNFLQYYEFYKKMPHSLHPQIEAMPRQAVYTLASREGELSQKEEIVRNYKGETKQAMLTLIRSVFPLQEGDLRKEDLATAALKQLQQVQNSLKNVRFNSQQREYALELIALIQNEVIHARTNTK